MGWCLMPVFQFGFVLGAADKPGRFAAIDLELGPEQATAQCLGGGIKWFMAVAGTFGHNWEVYPPGVSPDELLDPREN